MLDATEAFRLALDLVLTLDPELMDVVGLSLSVTLSAVLIASAVGLPLGAVLVLARFPGRSLLVVCVNTLMGLPPVVVGLAVYLVLSRAGPLGGLGLLFTPAAMVVAQTLLVLPIITALSRRVISELWDEYREQLRSLDVPPLRIAATLLWDSRFSLVTAVLAGFGRAAAEVGAVMIVGGNIDGVTRTMTTAIALETSKGNLALALALGVVLVGLIAVLNGIVFLIGAQAERKAGRHAQA